MVTSVVRLLAVSCCVSMTAVVAHASDLTKYRDFTLGSSVSTVRELTKASDGDVVSRFERPSLLQAIEWRVPQLTAGTSADDAVRDMGFDFVDDRLYRLTATYDERRTEGLTRADMIASLETLYGPRGTSAVQSRRGFDASGVTVLAQWLGGDAMVTLEHVSYLAAYRLVVTSVSLHATARKAEVLAQAIEAREAPLRAAARQKQAAADDRAAQDQARDRNKAAFRP